MPHIFDNIDQPLNMWENYRAEYRLRGRVLSISRVLNELPDLRRCRLVIDLWETDRLCIIEEERQTRGPQIVCSLGLRTNSV